MKQTTETTARTLRVLTGAAFDAGVAWQRAHDERADVFACVAADDADTRRTRTRAADDVLFAALAHARRLCVVALR